jgi:protein-tyrosine phosphatase
VFERTSPSTSSGPTHTTEEQIVLGLLPTPDDAQFAAVYVGLLERLAPELRVILERAVDAPDRPLLFHCAAGKDRTGIAAAVLLGLLGVPDEVILDDYELTSTCATPRRMQTMSKVMAEHGIPVERVRPLVEARRPVMAVTLLHLREQWDGFDGFAINQVGVAARLPDQLRNALLVRSTQQLRQPR